MWGSTIGGIVTLILSLLTAPLTSTAQQAAKVPRLGLLIPGSSSDFAPRIERLPAWAGQPRVRRGPEHHHRVPLCRRPG